MSYLSSTQPALMRAGRKADARTQFAVLGYTMGKSKPRVCLVTSRQTGRWILPKGWPVEGATPVEAVAAEAWEEAGLRGRVHPQPVGLFSYQKLLEDVELPVIAVVYAMRVFSAASTYPEAHERKRKWFTPRKAAARLSDPEVAPIVRGFAPGNLRG